jgi:hypothetical protein
MMTDGSNKSVAEVLQSRLQGRAPASLADFEFLGQTLQKSSDSKEVEGGDDILKNRGYLANIKNDDEMPYADIQAMGLLGMAATGYDGRLGVIADTGNQLVERLGGGGALVVSSAQKIMKQTRPDARDRYGLISYVDEKGKMRYKASYSDPYSEAALGSAYTLKGTDWTSAKGEAVDEMAETYKGIASGAAEKHWRDKGNSLMAAGGKTNIALGEKAFKVADEAAAQRENIKSAIGYGANNIYVDPGQREAWKKIANSDGVLSAEELAQYRIYSADENARRIIQPPDSGGGPLGGGPPGGAGPPALGG